MNSKFLNRIDNNQCENMRDESFENEWKPKGKKYIESNEIIATI